MKAVPVSTGAKAIMTHAATALATLMLVMLASDRLVGSRRPLLAQVLRRSAPPVAVPAFLVEQEDGAGPRAGVSEQPPAPPEDVLKDLDPEERNNIRIYNAANKGVVNITTEAEVSSFFGDETSTGTGSGFVVDKQGHILTNFHVVQGVDHVRVTMYDGSAHEARIIGADASNDVAVLYVRVPPEKLFPLTFGESSRLMVGQKILALGNPFGLERTLTTGIVSSLERSLRAKNGRVIKGIIQTDAAINPGNSGGPLLNTRGQVIGMNTAIVSQVGQSAGISFAVPIQPILRILQQLIEHGRVIRADLGITRVFTTNEGLVVVSVAEGGPADRAGVQPIRMRVERLAPGYIRQTLDPSTADMIVAVEHKRVRTLDELMTEIEKHRPGEQVRITVIRAGKPKDIPVELGQS
jgi:S1-C subfamily serine protease